MNSTESPANVPMDPSGTPVDPSQSPGGRMYDWRLRTHAVMDEMVMAVFRRNGIAVRDHAVVEMAEDTMAALDVARSRGWFEDPDAAFENPDPPSLVEIRTGLRSAAFHYDRIRFDSEYRPDPELPGAARWSVVDPNSHVHAWVMRHEHQAPWIVCAHGTGMGRPLADFGLFRANWLHEELGLNVVMPVLPLHGPRRGSAPDGMRYPSEHMVDNLHGTLQSVSDVRSIIGWIRAQDNTAPIALHGVSLGGYVSALVASMDSRLACVVVGAPVVDLEALMEYHMAEEASDIMRDYLTSSRELSAVTSPLAHDPVLSRRRTFIYAGVVDRMVSRRGHALRLWYHWDKPSALWFAGGHAALGRSKPVEAFIAEALTETGVLL